MADPKDTVYRAEAHTRAKHQILEAYLTAWSLILSHQSKKVGRRQQRLLYVDGFAGAGEYEDDVPGSPLVAIDALAHHAAKFSIPVHIKLIESRQDRADHLTRLVNKKRKEHGAIKQLVIDDPIQGDCESKVNALIDEYDRQNQRLGPALFFLDQYGYSAFSMSLIGRILRHEVCEVFSYLNWNLLHPFMADPTKHAGITKAFGGDEWKRVIGLAGKDKEDTFRDIYLLALRSRAGAIYAYPFAMRDQKDQVIYWLFFCSNNLRGLEEMKRAMWKVDRTGGFEFSDKYASQFGLMFKYYKDEDLANDLAIGLTGQELSVRDVKEHVLVETPAYKYKRALAILERTKRLEAVEARVDRRQGTFKDETMRVRLLRTDQSSDRDLFDPPGSNQ